MNKIYIFGTFPSPVGGTSIHVYRLFKYMQKFFIVTGVDTYGNAKKETEGVISVSNYKKFLLNFIFNSCFDLLHSHTHSWNERFILGVICKIKFKKIVFTFHSLRSSNEKQGFLFSLKVKVVSFLADAFICPNKDIEMQLLKMGVCKKKLYVIPTLLLPENSSTNNLDARVNNFLSSGDILVTANASNTNKYQGVDLYGLDMFIQLCQDVKSVENIKFIYCLTKVTDKKYYNECLDKITKLGISDKLLIVNAELDFSNVLQRTDIFIRPTCYDSYGISVGEAIHLKVPALASDVCERAAGSILFKNRDNIDLNLKFKDVLENLDKYKTALNDIELVDNSKDIKQLYDLLLTE